MSAGRQCYADCEGGGIRIALGNVRGRKQLPRVSPSEIGFDAAGLPVSADGGGFGLTAMRQRVERLSGTLEIESERGAGTAISACVPAPCAEELPQGHT